MQLILILFITFIVQYMILYLFKKIKLNHFNTVNRTLLIIFFLTNLFIIMYVFKYTIILIILCILVYFIEYYLNSKKMRMSNKIDDNIIKMNSFIFSLYVIEFMVSPYIKVQFMLTLIIYIALAILFFINSTFISPNLKNKNKNINKANNIFLKLLSIFIIIYFVIPKVKDIPNLICNNYETLEGTVTHNSGYRHYFFEINSKYTFNSLELYEASPRKGDYVIIYYLPNSKYIINYLKIVN